MGFLEIGALLAGLTFWHTAELNQKMIEAAKRGDANTVAALLDQGANVNAKGVYGSNALAFAADRGHVEVVQVLIKHKANVNVRDSFYSATPLTWATNKKHLEIIKALLKAGATGADATLLSAVKDADIGLVQAVLDSAK